MILPRLDDSIPRIRSYTNAKKIYNSIYTEHEIQPFRSLRLSLLSLLSLSCIIFRRTRGRKVSPAFLDFFLETRGNARFNCRSKINSRLKMRGT